MDAVNMTPGNAGTVVKHPGILYPLMLIAAIAVIVFSVAGIATMMGWMPGALSSDAGPARAQPVPASKLAQPRVVTTAATDCRDCGVVESMRAVEKSVNYEIRVRMNDGTYRTLYERARPVLTIGQKVRVTDRGVVAAG
jgi:hypothetical protein